jgi:hypothetical protein
MKKAWSIALAAALLLATAASALAQGGIVWGD